MNLWPAMLQGRQLNALEAAAEVVGKGSGLWSTLDLLLQSGRSAVQLQKGTVTGYWSGENFRALQPPQPQANAKVVTPAAELRIRIVDQARRRPVRLLGSCNGGYILDKQVVPLLRNISFGERLCLILVNVDYF